MKRLILSLFIIASLAEMAEALETRWSPAVPVPAGGRPNILDLNPVDYDSYVLKGKIHTQIYPVTITGALVPENAVKNFLESSPSNPLKLILRKAGADFIGLNSLDDFQRTVGLHKYPDVNAQGIYAIPYPNGKKPNYRVGYGTINRYNAKGFTISCAACHSSNLFGTTVLGLTNRFPKANEYFIKTKKYAPVIKPLVNTWLFDMATDATPSEKKMIVDTLDNLQRVEAKAPIANGLDTSLAQVALSLNIRADDEWATPSMVYQILSRPDEFLDYHPADSKPAVWWNLKYKNRWLSDGSVVQGNPIITNLLWNEIGRGSDLKQLGNWINQNKTAIDELTASVFANEAPRLTDFFDISRIDIASARRGETIFNTSCAKCHGNYDKVWSQPGSEQLSIVDQIRTTLVRYPEQTKVIDVGTDPNRYLGMRSLVQLNKLRISKDNEVIIQAQKGYVPPPLVGIWARWPYFHNNSAPSLCAVLTPASQRPKVYFSGEALSKTKDFDYECNGYPLGDKTPANWKTAANKFDTSKEGMRNTGHDERIFMENGKELLTAQDKKDLIQFLQTL